MGECYTRLRDIYDPEELPDSVLKEFEGMMEKLKEKMSPGDAMVEFRQKIEAQAKIFEENNVRERLLKSIDSQKIKQRIEMTKNPLFAGNPGEAGLSNMGGSDLPVAGAVEVPHVRRMAIHQLFSTMLEKGIETVQGLRPMLEDGSLDREIMQELFHFGTDKAGSTGSALAQNAAKVVKALNDALIQELERATGVKLGRVDNFITKTVHVGEKLLTAGKEQWVKDILPKLDLEKTFGPILGKDMEYVKKELAGAWESIVKNESGVGGGKGELHSRTFQWKDGNSFYDYNKQYGPGDLYTMLRRRIDAVSRSSALMEFFGSDPQGGFEQIINFLGKQEGAESGVRFDYKQNYMRALFKEVSGNNSIPGTHAGYVLSNLMMSHNNLTNLNNVGLRSFFTNIGSGVAAISANTGKNVLSSFVQLIGEAAKTVSKETMAQAAEHYGLFHQDFMDGLRSDLRSMGIGPDFKEAVAEAIKQGKLTPEAARQILEKSQAYQRTFFKYMIGIDAVQKRTQIAINNVLGTIVADWTKVGWEGLDARAQANLGRAGIAKPQFELLKEAIVTDKFGRELIAPEKLSEVPIERVQEIMTANGVPSNVSAKNFLRTTQLQYLGYLADAGQMATTSAGPRVGLAMRMGLPRDSWGGIALSLINQFKTFSVGQFNLLRRVKTADPMSGSRGILDMKGDWAGVATFAGLMTGTWLMSEQVRQLGQGKQPDSLLKGSTWTNAMIKGGAFGILGDVLDSESSHATTGLGGYVIGPTGTKVASALEIAMEGSKGHKVAKKASALATSLVPFQNHLILQHVVGPLIIDPLIREGGLSLDPTYHQRQATRQARERAK